MFIEGTLLSGNKIIQDLSKDNDMFGTIDKADCLIDILNNMYDEIEYIQRIAIYGEFGSGKSTYIKYLNKEIGRKETRYKSLVFDVREYDLYDELDLALMGFLMEKYDDLFRNLKNDLYDVLSKIKITCKLKDSFNNEISIESQFKKENINDNILDFKKKYEEIIEKILTKENKKRLIICIDNLDYYEPEKAIQLISTVEKLFMDCDKVKYIFTLNRSAVESVFISKYGDAMKSEHYLGEVFDLSFTLNKTKDISKIIRCYFNEYDVKPIKSFFEDMGIIDPKKLIKILNTALFLERRLLRGNRIQEIYETKNKNYSFEDNRMFYSLLIYFIIYKEYYPNEYDELFDIDKKKKNFTLKKRSLFYSELDRLSEHEELIISENFMEGLSYEEFILTISPSFKIDKYFKKNQFDDFVESMKGVHNNYSYNFIKLCKKNTQLSNDNLIKAKKNIAKTKDYISNINREILDIEKIFQEKEGVDAQKDQGYYDEKNLKKNYESLLDESLLDKYKIMKLYISELEAISYEVENMCKDYSKSLDEYLKKLLDIDTITDDLDKLILCVDCEYCKACNCIIIEYIRDQKKFKNGEIDLSCTIEIVFNIIEKINNIKRNSIDCKKKNDIIELYLYIFNEKANIIKLHSEIIELDNSIAEAIKKTDNTNKHEFEIIKNSIARANRNIDVIGYIITKIEYIIDIKCKVENIKDKGNIIGIMYKINNIIYNISNIKYRKIIIDIIYKIKNAKDRVVAILENKSSETDEDNIDKIDYMIKELNDNIFKNDNSMKIDIYKLYKFVKDN